MEMVEQNEVKSTTARISMDTQRALTERRLALGAMFGRELSNDDVIRIMHDVFVQQPVEVIRQAVQP